MFGPSLTFTASSAETMKPIHKKYYVCVAIHRSARWQNFNGFLGFSKVIDLTYELHKAGMQ